MTQPSDAALRIAREIEREALRANGGVYNPAAFIQRIAAAIDEAVREEQEQCAKIADASEEEAEKDYRRWYNSCDQGRSDASAEIASAIRNRQP